jgi:hypothetical protein
MKLKVINMATNKKNSQKVCLYLGVFKGKRKKTPIKIIINRYEGTVAGTVGIIANAVKVETNMIIDIRFLYSNLTRLKIIPFIFNYNYLYVKK